MTSTEEFNEYLLACFGTPAGERVLAGMMNRYGQVVPPTASDAELRHREGQRSVLADIMQGISDGRERRRRAAEQRTDDAGGGPGSAGPGGGGGTPARAARRGARRPSGG